MTDHNSGAWIDEMKRAAQGTILTIFPGVEISTHENYHVVALFDPTVGKAEVEGLLSALDFRPDQFGYSDITCTKGIYDIFEIAHKRGAMVILAHIDEFKGAYYEQVSQEVNPTTGKVKLRVPGACAQLFNRFDYDAVEVVNGQLPEGLSAKYGINRIPTFYQSSDNPDPADPKKHSKLGYAQRYTWFSMDEISLEALRQCFADPEVRIRQMQEIIPQHRPHIVSLRFGPAGFLAHQNIEFHPGLNCLVGHKGTGKSLAIEALRFALNQASVDVDLHKDHVSKLERKLGPLNSVEVQIRLQSGSIYRIESKYEGNGRATRVCTNVDTGEQYNGDLAQLFPVLAYSQTEVIKIAEDEQAQLRLADTLIDAKPLQLQIRQINERLCENDHAVAEALLAKEKLQEAAGEDATLRERVTNIDLTLKSSLVADMRQAENKADYFNRQHDLLAELAGSRQIFADTLAALNIPALPPSLTADSDLAAGQKVLANAFTQTQQYLVQIATLLTTAEDTITTLHNSWQPHFDELRKQYDEQLRGSDSARLEVERRLAVEKLNQLDKSIARYQQQVDEELPQLRLRREQLLDELEAAHLRYFNVRNAKFAQLTLASAGKVQLKLTHAANREEYTRALSDMLKGSGPANVPTVTRQKIADQVDPRTLTELVVDCDIDKLAEKAGLTIEMASRVIQRLWSIDNFEDILALQHERYPTDVPEIHFNKGSNVYAPISELSVGQKCTALLIIALCDGSMPVIIDQPEDALDIASVWDDVAKKLRQGKQARQFILTTHNSSLAVGSDSDTFYVLEPVGGDRAKISIRGAIDRKKVRDALIDNLEGGEKPYLLKNQKYNVH